MQNNETYIEHKQEISKPVLFQSESHINPILHTGQYCISAGSQSSQVRILGEGMGG